MQREIIDPFKDNQRNIWDWESIKQTAFMEGKKEGIRLAKEQYTKMALVGIEEGLSNALLMKLTKLSEQEINKLRQTK